MFNVTFNDGSMLECSAPVSGEELLRARGLENAPVPVVAWHVDHLLRPLNWVIDDDVQVDWIDLSTPEGMAVYQSSLSFLLCIHFVKDLLDVVLELILIETPQVFLIDL